MLITDSSDPYCQQFYLLIFKRDNLNFWAPGVKFEFSVIENATGKLRF